MTESDKKLVTEWLGECWHEWEDIRKQGPFHILNCTKCNKIVDAVYYTEVEGFYGNRTFTEPADFFACWRKLEKTGPISTIFEYGSRDIGDLHEVINYEETHPDNIYYDPQHTQWLLDTTEDGTFRLPNLIAEALEEGVIK